MSQAEAPFRHFNKTGRGKNTRTGRCCADESTSLTMSVQKELAQLGYYHGPIDGITGLATEQATRWFQSVDRLPMTGQIDGAIGVDKKDVPDRCKNKVSKKRPERAGSFVV
jgi:peptidoglycan hydrolase-like protein with peptidoglycan-binding domain